MANKFKAGDLFPSITLPTLNGETVSIGQPQGDLDWKMVVVYRGKHCPLCTRYLNQIESLKSEFNALGVDIIAVSADSEAQAQTHKQELDVSFPIAYGMTIEQMQQLGLYLSLIHI